MKGRILRYARYKAWNEAIITSRVTPRNTSRACARCHALVIRYNAAEPASGYTPGAALVLCPQCRMQGHADRNASLVIAQRLIERSQGKPPPPLAPERGAKAPGVAVSQDAESNREPSSSLVRHGNGNGHGTAQDAAAGMAELASDIPAQLRLFWE